LIDDNQLHFASLNIRSIRNKAAHIYDILDRGMDLLALQETWHESADDIALKIATPVGYNVIDVPRSQHTCNMTSRLARGGGVAILYRDNIRCKPLHHSPNVSTFEYVAADFQMAASHLIAV
jgi:exonuclease III